MNIKFLTSAQKREVKRFIYAHLNARTGEIGWVPTPKNGFIVNVWRNLSARGIITLHEYGYGYQLSDEYADLLERTLA